MNAFIIFPCFRASKALWSHFTIFCSLFPVFLPPLLLWFCTFLLPSLQSHQSLLSSTPSSVTLCPLWSSCYVLVQSEMIQISRWICWASEVLMVEKGHPKHMRQCRVPLMESVWVHSCGFREKQGWELEQSRVLFQWLGEISPLA